jgi:hypothetical protein
MGPPGNSGNVVPVFVTVLVSEVFITTSEPGVLSMWPAAARVAGTIWQSEQGLSVAIELPVK